MTSGSSVILIIQLAVPEKEGAATPAEEGRDTLSESVFGMGKVSKRRTEMTALSGQQGKGRISFGFLCSFKRCLIL